MAKLVRLIRGPSGSPYGEVRDDGGREIESGVCRLREHSQASRDNAHDELRRGQKTRGNHRAESRRLLLRRQGGGRLGPAGERDHIWLTFYWIPLIPVPGRGRRQAEGYRQECGRAGCPFSP